MRNVFPFPRSDLWGWCLRLTLSQPSRPLPLRELCRGADRGTEWRTNPSDDAVNTHRSVSIHGVR